jgi:hypothetical protein
MFFRKSEEKKAREAAAQAEVDRLQGLSPDALAVEVLPVIGSDALKRGVRGTKVQEVIKGLFGGSNPSWTVNTGVLLLPVREALQRLEHANLVIQLASGVDQATFWRITTEGEAALVDGDTPQKLGLQST